MVRLPEFTEIDFLVSRRYPNALALQPFPSLTRANSGPRVDSREMKRAVDAYRAELAALPADELSKLHTAERAKQAEEFQEKAEREERERFFNQPYANADIDYWSKAAHWTLDEAIALSFGKAPERVNWQTVKPFMGFSRFAFEYGRRRELALRAVPWKQLFDPVLPVIFISWCKRTGLSCPAELEAAITARGQIVDWKSRYEELEVRAGQQATRWAELSEQRANEWQEIVQGRDDTIAELQSRIAELQRKSVSTKERDSLLKLVIGLAVGGYGFDPSASRSEQPQTIADDLARLGVALDVDTVRKWLREAAQLLQNELPTKSHTSARVSQNR